MKIIGRDGNQDYHVFGAICGIRAKEVVLDARDFYLLSAATPEQLKNWVTQVSHRFSPADLYKAKEPCHQSLIGRK